eukprot:TRINITY_DN8878_c0_g1_i1.p1 TRINITY_DN8878_c0_g1~~TRINITY_DN8878_c0_g1_i1.p1  ORF type:complete len:419 (+),score=75.78 TRINITY_DN8878_c0_g1_i1:3-1259(+)
MGQTSRLSLTPIPSTGHPPSISYLHRMALRGIKVIEIAGLAPAPFCGMILSDFGADVIRVDRPNAPSFDQLCRGKRSIGLDLKSPDACAVLLRMVAEADVIIEPFRPGVMERLGLGPSALLAANPRLVYARLTGFGQTGPYAKMAGHDINYLSLSGALSIIGRKGDAPVFPANILADFAGGGLMCALGITLALLERARSGKGQVVDTAMVDGVAYLSSFVYLQKNLQGKGESSTSFLDGGLDWSGERGTNLLDTGAPFYEVYRTKDGKYMAVGALEPAFYALLLNGLGLDQASLPAQMDQTGWPEMKRKFTDIFMSKTRDEWSQIFAGSDACVTPVLDMEEVASHPYGAHRGIMTDSGPAPAPALSRTPGVAAVQVPAVGQHTREVLTRVKGMTSDQVNALIDSGAAFQSATVPMAKL